MTELSGTLDGVGLPAIIHFLTGLQKTGCLRVVHGDWHGEIFFEAGQLTDASLGSRHGLSALDGLVEALPGGNFAFDTDGRPGPPPSIDLSPEAMQAHLDTLVARIVGGKPSLPSVDSVPELIVQAELGKGEDPLPLDRGTLQTLLAVDGQRTVRAIVADRGSFDALWQLGRLAEVGLVRQGSTPGVATVLDPAPAVREVLPAEPDAVPPVSPIEADSAIEPEPAEAADRCPKLGFEDDPGSSFGRPTRLHRCFAATTPLPLSLDQQRELCLSDQYPTCPRLTMVGRGAARHPSGAAESAPPSIAARRNLGGNTVAAAHSEPEDPRIVRLPFPGRTPSAPRGGSVERAAGSASDAPTQLRPSSFSPRPADSPRPMPLRARMDRAANKSAAAPVDRDTFPAAAGLDAEPTAPSREPRPARAVPASRPIASPLTTRVGGSPSRLAALGLVAVLALAVLVYLAVPHLSEWFPEDNPDLSGLPNANAVANGTPVAQLAPRPTPAARASSVPVGAAGSSATNAGGQLTEPTLLPEITPITVAPSVVNQASSAQPGSAQPGTTQPGTTQPATAQPATAQPAAAGPAAPRPATATTVLDERFVDNARNWPSNPQGTTWLTSGSYHLITRQPGQFVAVGVPLPDALQDVIVSATFRKLDGSPAGGGFGIIVRDQSLLPLDGVNQGGRYYVFEVGDKGEVGIWQREVDHWVDLLSWQHADAVHPGTATNDLVVSAIGTRLTMSVNGTQVAARTDSALPTGRVALLAGGDGNQIAVDHLTIQTP